MVFQGHMMPIKRIVWAPGDQVVFTAGMDGNVYGWPIAKDARIDVLSANNRLFGVNGMCIDTINLVFPKPEQKEHESGDADGVNDSAVALKAKTGHGPVQSLETRKSVIVSLVDGVIKVCPWEFELGSINHHPGDIPPPTVFPGDAVHAITTLYISPKVPTHTTISSYHIQPTISSYHIQSYPHFSSMYSSVDSILHPH